MTAHHTDSRDRRGLATADDVARYLTVSTDTVYRLAKAGTIPSVRVGKLVRFDLDAVEQHLERRQGTVAGTSKAASPME